MTAYFFLFIQEGHTIKVSWRNQNVRTFKPQRTKNWRWKEKVGGEERSLGFLRWKVNEIKYGGYICVKEERNEGGIGVSIVGVET